MAPSNVHHNARRVLSPALAGAAAIRRLPVGIALLVGACTMDRSPVLEQPRGAGAGGSASTTGNISTRQVLPPVFDDPPPAGSATGCADVGAAERAGCAPVPCTDGVVVAVERCNGIDDDCDALIDEDESACEPTAHCRDGSCVPDLLPGGSCSGDHECASGHCDHGTCCADGACCWSAVDCPGHVAQGEAACLDPASCGGVRTDVVCGADFRCRSVVTADASACDGALRDCEPYADVQCPAECATACAADDECAPDTPCVDRVCCESACAGTCETCNAAGECVPIAAGSDPDEECGALECDEYYSGWVGATCFARASAAAEQVACDGAGACQTAAEICPSQPPGADVGTCPVGECSWPAPRTCTDTMVGLCLVDTSCAP